MKIFTLSMSTFLLIIGCAPTQRGLDGNRIFGNLGAGELIMLILIIIIFLSLIGRRRGSFHFSGPTLVLKKFRIDESAIPIEIVGRASGITSWILTLVGLDAETSLSVHHSKISFKSSSLYGEVHQVIPLPNVSSTHCGYTKPFGLLILGILLLFIGLFVQKIILGLILGGIFIVYYFLSKKITIIIETCGGLQIGLVFKRSVIENVSIDIQEGLKVIDKINENIIKQQEKNK